MKRVESFRIDDDVKKVWFFTAEFSGIASLGGLGNAVGGIAKELAKRGIEVDVFMPSHGRHSLSIIRDQLKLYDPGITVSGYRTGADGNHYDYKLGFERGKFDKINIIMVRGLDSDSARILDDPDIYSNAMEKSALFTRAIDGLVNNVQIDEVPSIIHSNDWHSALPGIKAKLAFEQRRIIVPLIYTVHLLTKVTASWHYVSPEWAGLEDYYHYIWAIARHIAYKTNQLWNSCQESIEKFACYEADAIASVSKSYLINDVFSYIGSFIENKSCVTYNATDWDIDKAKDLSVKYFGSNDRSTARKAAYKLVSLQRVIPEDHNAMDILFRKMDIMKINDDWSTKQLNDGPLVLFTGRITNQKGVDLLIDAFRKVKSHINNANLILVGIPSMDYEMLEKITDSFAEINSNSRLLLSYEINRELYMALHFVASVFVAPSRWEPFGINAIESMAVGTPVVAYDVGGLSETVVDIRKSNEGTGFTVEPENVNSLAAALESAIYLSLADESKNAAYLEKSELYKTNDINYWSTVRNNSVIHINKYFLYFDLKMWLIKL